MNSPPSILVGITSRAVHVKVEGKGSFQNSPALKEFSKRMLERGCRHFVVDLNGCPVMDSTFMGTLAGIALRLREFGNGSLLVRNANERNADLLLAKGNVAAALAEYRARRDIIERLVKADSSNGNWQRDLSASLPSR